MNHKLVAEILERLSNFNEQEKIWCNIRNYKSSEKYTISSLREDLSRLYIDSGLHTIWRDNKIAYTFTVDEQIKKLLLLAQDESLYAGTCRIEGLFDPKMIEIRNLSRGILFEIKHIAT